MHLGRDSAMTSRPMNQGLHAVFTTIMTVFNCVGCKPAEACYYTQLCIAHCGVIYSQKKSGCSNDKDMRGVFLQVRTQPSRRHCVWEWLGAFNLQQLLRIRQSMIKSIPQIQID